MTASVRRQRAMSDAEVAEIVRLAADLVDANARRSPASQNATLGEENAIFNLRWALNQLKEVTGL